MRRPVAVLAGSLAFWLTFAAPAPSTPVGGTTSRVSVSGSGVEGDDHSADPAVSAHGRYVVFWSAADNLVPDDTNRRQDVFVRDRQTGTTSRVSVASDGAEADGMSSAPAVSAHGRYVVFVSRADNLVSGDTNGCPDVFVRDRRNGITRRVSVARGGAQSDAASFEPALSAHGRYVVFVSRADNLVANDTNGRPDVFIRDTRTGTTRLVTRSSSGIQADSASFEPAVSAHGRYVAFASYAHNLVPRDTNNASDIFVRDTKRGTTRLVSRSSRGAHADSGDSSHPTLSAHGRFVAFASNARNLVPRDSNHASDIFVRDTKTGTTRRVSVSGRGVQGDSASYLPAISADGGSVAFISLADNLVPHDTNTDSDVFLRDRSTGTTRRVSVSSTGEQGDFSSGLVGVAVSADGRYIGFDSAAQNLVLGDTNLANDVFVRDTGG